MDTSDEGIIAQGAGITQDLLGKKAAGILDPIGRKVLKSEEEKKEDEEARKRESASALGQEKRTVTATTASQESEVERRNRLRRRNASVGRQGLGAPTLGRAGLLGGGR